MEGSSTTAIPEGMQSYQAVHLKSPEIIRGFFSFTVPMQQMQGPLIRTKYLGPTNYRGSRITAVHKRDSEQTQRVTLSWDHSLDGLENAKAAALALLNTWPYRQDMVLVACGWDHDHYYFVASPAPLSNPA